MLRSGRVFFSGMLLATLGATTAPAQDACCFQPSFRLQCETVLQPQTVQRMRVTYQTDYVDEQVTSFRPVLKTRTEQREYSVAVPVTETSFREEKYTVMKPIIETSQREETVQQTSYVTETSEREEQYTTYKPVVETQMYQQRFLVQRPVTQTQMVEQRFLVQRPVVETQLQTQQYTSLRPITSVQNRTIDTGGFVAQQVVTPGQVGVGLNYYPRAFATPGPLGLFARVRGGYAVGPQVTPATVQTQFSYRPNLVTQQFAQTSWVPQTQQVQVPVQVQRTESEVVTQRVPVSVQSMQSETVVQNVPVQTTRMVATTATRKVPVTVTKPVTQTITRKVPVRRQRWITEEKVRKVPVQTTRITYETRKRPVEVSYYEQEQFTQTVRRPVIREVLVPYEETIMVPQQVVQRVPLSYYDPFSPAIVNGFSSFRSSTVTPLSSSSIPLSSSVTPEVSAAKPAVTQPESDAPSSSSDKSVLDQHDGSGAKLEKIEIEKPNTSQAIDPADANELPQPRLDNQPSLKAPANDLFDAAEGSFSTPATEAGWRIPWMPRLGREA